MCIGTATKDYIYFSPSVPVDQTWQAVKAQQEKTMKVTETPKEQLYVDHYKLEDLQTIIDTHHKVIVHMSTTKSTQMILYINYH